MLVNAYGAWVGGVGGNARSCPSGMDIASMVGSRSAKGCGLAASAEPLPLTGRNNNIYFLMPLLCPLRPVDAKYFEMVPGEGVEPSLPCGNWILNPARLPIPPSGPSGNRHLYGTKRLASSEMGSLGARGTCSAPGIPSRRKKVEVNQTWVAIAEVEGSRNRSIRCLSFRGAKSNDQGRCRSRIAPCRGHGWSGRRISDRNRLLDGRCRTRWG